MFLLLQEKLTYVYFCPFPLSSLCVWFLSQPPVNTTTAQNVWDIIASPLLIEWLLLEQEDTKLHESQWLKVDLTKLSLSNKQDDLKLKPKTNHHLQCWRCWPHQADIIWFKDSLAVSCIPGQEFEPTDSKNFKVKPVFTLNNFSLTFTATGKRKLKPNQMKHRAQDICQSIKMGSLYIFMLSLVRLSQWLWLSCCCQKLKMSFEDVHFLSASSQRGHCWARLST